jgi:5'-nucleotidase/UDP-sugar diphosphatase
MKQKWALNLVLSVLIGLTMLFPACGPTAATSITTSSPAPASPALQTAPYSLTILHTSENHGHWEPVEASKVSQGGIARRATLVKQLRSAITNTLLLDSGDISQGTLYFAQNKGSEGREFYNLLGYDAVVPGNHEFDPGPALLADNFLNGAQYSVVLANVDFSAEPLLAGRIPACIVKTIGGEKIGIFGLVTEELVTTSNVGPNIKMKDTTQAARDTVAALARQGVNKVILLSHLGFPADQELASKVAGIDVIVSGHTDTLMGESATLDPSLGKPASPYPFVVNSPAGHRTLIIHAYIWGRLLGRLNLVFNAGGEITGWDGGPILVDKSIVEDPIVAQRLASLAASLNDLKKQVIGRTTIELDGRKASVRNRESNLGNLIADAMLWSTRSDGTLIALANGGGIRASIPAGDISYGQVLECLPFGNRLVQFDLPGDDLADALENSLSKMEADPETSNGRFLQVAGLKFKADLTRPLGSRVTSVLVGSAELGFKPLDKTAVYRVAALDFMFNGGDGYTMLQNGRNLHGGDVPEEMVLIDYLKAHSPVNPRLEDRITFMKP